VIAGRLLVPVAGLAVAGGLVWYARDVIRDLVSRWWVK
jgi:hypothetical protein